MTVDIAGDAGGGTRRCRLFKITGRVQGVYFRGSTRSVANRLGISGHALNRSDGSVDVLACGSDAALAELEDWLQRGPTGARVDAVVADDHDDPGVGGFTTG